MTEQDLPTQAYATYCVGLFVDDMTDRGGEHTGGAGQRAHLSDQRVHDAVPNHQLACLQQLLE